MINKLGWKKVNGSQLVRVEVITLIWFDRNLGEFQNFHYIYFVKQNKTKRKNGQMGLHKIKKLLHNKRNGL
jgi:hypothetical protein